MQRIAEAKQRLADNETDQPANVGGEVVSDNDVDRENGTFTRYFANGTGIF